MIRSGLVSVSFRALSTVQICELAARANLRGIEWGGDVHVPPGNTENAREVAKQTGDAGLQVACYGSYYRAGNGDKFSAILETAQELGAPSIRVWAGEASENCDAARRAEIIADLHEISCQAARCNIVVATEYHAGTLTDSLPSAAQMLDETARSPLQTLWQPPLFKGEKTVEENLASLRAVRSRLLNVHVYHWTKTEGAMQRHALREGRAQWKRYFAELRDFEAWALLEFVRDDEPKNLMDDARALDELLEETA